MRLRYPALLATTILGLAALALAADLVLIEDWSAPPGTKASRVAEAALGSPNTTSPSSRTGHKVLPRRRRQLNINRRSRASQPQGTISVGLEGDGPAPGPTRGKKETDDQAAQLRDVARFPKPSARGSSATSGTRPRRPSPSNQKTGTVTYVVLRSGTADAVGHRAPERPRTSEDLRGGAGARRPFLRDRLRRRQGTAESYMGAIVFRRPWDHRRASTAPRASSVAAAEPPLSGTPGAGLF
jgi:hypothetical protein